MYKIYWTNFDYYSSYEFVSFGACLRHGQKRGMEFRIDSENGTPLASWSPIGGFRDLVERNSRWEEAVRKERVT